MHKGDEGQKRAPKVGTVEQAIDAARLPVTRGVSALAEGSKRLRRLLETSGGATVVQLPHAWVEQIAGLPGVDPHPLAFASLSPEVHAAFAAAWNSPEGQGWLRLLERLDEATGDPLVAASPRASEFLALMRELVGDSLMAQDGMSPVRDLQSALAAINANARHEPMRAAEKWVAEEWAKHGSGHKSKSDFARQYSARCIRERGVTVTDRTIREKWLKGL